MPTARPRAQARTDNSVGSRWARLRARVDQTGGDDGFTMVEMIVALVIIGIVMTALGSFFVSTVSATSRQGTSQAAIQLADDGIERVRAMDPTAILTGRDLTSSTTQWNSPVTGVAAYESDMAMAYDTNPNVTSGGATATLPTVGSPVVVNGLTYNQNWYIGQCWQPLGGNSPCTVASNPTANTYASFYRVVVAVTWSDSICTGGKCVFIATTLVSNALYDPQFNSNLTAQPPKVVNPGDQTSDTGVPVSLTLTPTGGAGAISWSATGLPTGLTMSISGVISGIPTATGTFSVAVAATDTFVLTGTATFSWTIVPPPVVTAATQTSEVGVADSYTASCNCTGPVTWAASGLPGGITINSATGLMSGTPTTANVTGSTVTLTATDAQGGSASPTFTWIVDPAISITTPGTQTSNAGTAITALQVLATGGTGSYTWTSSGLPGGLILGSTGRITGTPTAASAGTNSVTVTASDSLGGTATTATFTWTVGYTPPTITTPANQLSDAGTADSLTMTGTCGVPTCTWSAPGLPSGFSINSGTGVISVSTSAVVGQYSITVTIKDALNTTATTSSFIWTVVAAPTIQSPTNTISSSTSANLTGATAVTPLVSGGVAPYTWSAGTAINPNSTLPAGLSINTSTGAITGTPTTVHSYSVTLKVTDANGVVGTQVFTWSIVATSTTAINIQSPTANHFSVKGTAIAAVTSTFVGGPTSGGTTTWSTVSGSPLPAGLSINASTGTITGTPTTAATYTVQLKVTVTKGSNTYTDTQTITWTVYSNTTPLNAATPTSMTQSAHGSPITPVGATATGGSGSYSWSATGLPNGVTITTWGVLSGTPTTANNYTTVVLTVTDTLTGVTDTLNFSWRIT